MDRRVAGATIRELTELAGIHRTTVMAHLRRRTTRDPKGHSSVMPKGAATERLIPARSGMDRSRHRLSIDS